MNNAITKTDKDSYIFIKKIYEEEYNELYDSLYYYMLTYLEDDKMENYLFRDEIENYTGLREHVEIIRYIFISLLSMNLVICNIFEL